MFAGDEQFLICCTDDRSVIMLCVFVDQDCMIFLGRLNMNSSCCLLIT